MVKEIKSAAATAEDAFGKIDVLVRPPFPSRNFHA
jgi:hypothetical protein